MNHWKPAGLSVGILIKIPPRLQRSILRGTYYMYDVKKKIGQEEKFQILKNQIT